MISYDYVNLVKESVIFNEKDIYYNKEKFDSGEINLCFITAHSGGGKSSMALAATKGNEDKVDTYCLDDLQWSWKFSDNNLKEYGDLIYSFFNSSGKKYRIPYRIEKNGKLCGLTSDDVDKWYNDNGFKSITEYVDKASNAFVDYAIKYAKSNKNKKYILEGIQLFLFINPAKLKDYAVYIKGTSALISTLRGVKRDSLGPTHIIDNMSMFYRRILDTIGINGFEAKLSQYRKYFKNLMKEKEVKESFMDEYARVSKPWFVKASDGSINACLNVSGYEKPFRARSSMLILKDINNNPKVYFSYSDKDKEYHAPGGGWNENEDPEEAAVREAREEIHVNVKNVKPFGERLEYYEEIRDWVKDHVSNKKDYWYGYYSKIYVGEYDSKFTGKVNKEDEDSEINSGKFYVFDDIKDKIYPEYKSAIEAYLRSYK